LKTPADIQLGEIVSILKLQNKLRNQREWISILNHHHIEKLVILYSLEEYILLIKNTSTAIKNLKECIQLVQRFSVRNAFNSDYSIRESKYIWDDFGLALRISSIAWSH